jgi:hypothetical protein
LVSILLAVPALVRFPIVSGSKSETAHSLIQCPDRALYIAHVGKKGQRSVREDLKGDDRAFGFGCLEMDRGWLTKGDRDEGFCSGG